MKRAVFLSLAIVTVLSLVLAGCGQPAPAATKAPEATAPQEITVATDATWPPFESVNEQTKELEGFDIDLMNAIAKEANLKIKWVNVGFDPLLAGMGSGQYDAAIAVISIDEDRKKAMLFSDPYYDAGQLIAVRVDNTTILKPDDFKGKKVGAQISTTGAKQIEKVDPAALKTYDDIAQGFLDLMNGQIDAVVADSPLVYGFAAKYSSKIKAVGQPFTGEQYGIAVKKGGEALLAKINAGLKAVKDKGILKQLDDKWVKAAQ